LLLARRAWFGTPAASQRALVAHPAKLYRDKGGNYPIPTLYDISGSAHWRNKADNGLCIWRDMFSETAIVEIHIQKIRFRQIGRQGMAELSYSGVIGCYYEPSEAAASAPSSYYSGE
jgi:twinkle protein